MTQAYILNQVEGPRIFPTLTKRQQHLVNLIASLEVSRDGQPSTLEDIKNVITHADRVLNRKNTSGPLITPSRPDLRTPTVEQLADPKILRRELKGLFEIGLLLEEGEEDEF